MFFILNKLLKRYQKSLYKNKLKFLKSRKKFLLKKTFRRRITVLKRGAFERLKFRNFVVTRVKSKHFYHFRPGFIRLLKRFKVSKDFLLAKKKEKFIPSIKFLRKKHSRNFSNRLLRFSSVRNFRRRGAYTKSKVLNFFKISAIDFFFFRHKRNKAITQLYFFKDYSRFRKSIREKKFYFSNSFLVNGEMRFKDMSPFVFFPFLFRPRARKKFIEAYSLRFGHIKPRRFLMSGLVFEDRLSFSIKTSQFRIELLTRAFYYRAIAIRIFSLMKASIVSIRRSLMSVLHATFFIYTANHFFFKKTYKVRKLYGKLSKGLNFLRLKRRKPSLDSFNSYKKLMRSSVRKFFRKLPYKLRRLRMPWFRRKFLRKTYKRELKFWIKDFGLFRISYLHKGLRRRFVLGRNFSGYYKKLFKPVKRTHYFYKALYIRKRLATTFLSFGKGNSYMLLIRKSLVSFGRFLSFISNFFINKISLYSFKFFNKLVKFYFYYYFLSYREKFFFFKMNNKRTPFSVYPGALLKIKFLKSRARVGLGKRIFKLIYSFRVSNSLFFLKIFHKFRFIFRKYFKLRNFLFGSVFMKSLKMNRNFLTSLNFFSNKQNGLIDFFKYATFFFNFKYNHHKHQFYDDKFEIFVDRMPFLFTNFLNIYLISDSFKGDYKINFKSIRRTCYRFQFRIPYTGLIFSKQLLLLSLLFLRVWLDNSTIALRKKFRRRSQFKPFRFYFINI